MERSEQLVRSAVAAIRAEDKEQIQRTFVALGELPLDVMYAEVCTSIENTMRGKDVEALLNAPKISLPDDPKRLIISVWKQDFDDLADYAGGDLAKLMAALLVLNASLEDAGERLT